jgi:hypothetical protein
VCKINGKSAKNIARKSGKHQRSKNPPNWFLKGSVVFVGSKREVTSYSAYNFLIEPEERRRRGCGVAVAVPSGGLHLPLRGACGSEVSHRKLAS